MKVVLNGCDKEVPDGSTVRDLLALLGLAGRPAAVEVNRAVVPRAEHAARALAEGDRVEVVTLVGGG